MLFLNAVTYTDLRTQDLHRAATRAAEARRLLSMGRSGDGLANHTPVTPGPVAAGPSPRLTLAPRPEVTTLDAA